MRVQAFLAAPELAQTTARGVQRFVGRRPVRDRGLLHALAMGYGELVPRGRYPVAVVLVDVAAGAVDVNVHPQKVEVRFSDAGAVCAAVRHVVQAAIAAAPWRGEIAGGAVMMMTAIASVAPPALPYDGPATPLAERYASQLRASARVGAGSQLGFADTAPGPRAWVREVQDKVRASRVAEVAETRKGYGRAVDYVRAERDGGTSPTTFALTSTSTLTSDEALAEGSGPNAWATPAQATGYFARLRYLGQLDLTFLVCEADGELVLVDQHAAHERVELARLYARGGVRDAGVQKMLFPVTIDATPGELALIDRDAHVLARAGFEVEPFGHSTIAIKAVPAGIRHGEPSHVLRALLASWQDDGAPDADTRLARALSAIACHSVVRAGDRLVASEAEALLQTLDAAFVPELPDPHGRPILLRLPIAELARRFGR